MVTLYYLREWIKQGNPQSLKVFILFEILGLFIGVIFLVWLRICFLPLFLFQNESHLLKLLILWETTLFYIILSMGVIFLRHGFLKFFCIGTQIGILALTCYRLIYFGLETLLFEEFIMNHALIIIMPTLVFLYSIRRLWFSIIDLKVQQIPGIYGIAKFNADENFSGKFYEQPSFFFTTTRTRESLSVITESSIFLSNYPMHNNLVLFEFIEPNLKGQPQILFSKILNILNTVSIAHFTVSTFEKNYVLFDRKHLVIAHYVWTHSGVKVLN